MTVRRCAMPSSAQRTQYCGVMPRSANSTFSNAVIVEMRATDWNTNAISTRRSLSRSGSGSLVISLSMKSTSPEVGRSSAPRMLISVVLPEPERPRRTESRFGGICKLIPLSAWTVLPSPISKSMQIFCASIMCFIIPRLHRI